MVQSQNDNNQSKTSSSSSSSSSSISPYYSMMHFSLMLPIAIVHTLISHVMLYLTTGTKALESIEQSLFPGGSGAVDHCYPWQNTSTSSNSTDTSSSSSKQQQGVAIVTGSNTGIGFETARALVLDHGMIVILACRSRDKAMAAVDKINNEVTTAATTTTMTTTTKTTTTSKGMKAVGKAVFVHPLDLSSFDSIREFVRVLRSCQEYTKIHVLVNNAGRNSIGTAGLSSVEKNAAAAGDDLELDLLFQSNFLGHYLLTRLLLSHDALANNARIVNLSSVMHHFCGGYGLDLESPESWKYIAMAKQPPFDTYSFSKLAAILFTIELNRRHMTTIRSIAVNPGAVNSDIWRGFPRFMVFLFRLVYLNNRQGCRTSVVAAVGALDDYYYTRDENVLYLQPYKIHPWFYSRPTTPTTIKNNNYHVIGVPFPPMEALGPFMGFCPTQPRLFEDGGVRAAAALWKTCEELTAG